MIDIVIEEYEQGTWVAEVTDLVPFVGSVVINGTDTWIGTAKSTQQEAEKFLTKVVGGRGGLSTAIPDWYSKGSVSLAAALATICTNAGETLGAVQAGKILPVYQRLRGTAAQALDELATTLNLIWWIGRDGTVNMATQRPVGPIATGVQEDGGGDDSVTLIEPIGVQIGGTYNGQTIRHIRWHQNGDRYAAQIYFVPFLFRSPLEQSTYACQYDAKVDKNNGDGTIDVIAAGRFGVTKVPLYAGVPGAKITVKPGELVTLGFLGANPQAPYAVAHGQNSAATKLVARVKDLVDAGTFQFASSIATDLVVTWTPGPGIIPPTPVVAPVGSPLPVKGIITSGSARIALDDG